MVAPGGRPKTVIALACHSIMGHRLMRSDYRCGTDDPVGEAFQRASRPRGAGVSTLRVETAPGTMQPGPLPRGAAAAGGLCLRLADLAANTLATAVCLSRSGCRSGDRLWLRALHAATVG